MTGSRTMTRRSDPAMANLSTFLCQFISLFTTYVQDSMKSAKYSLSILQYDFLTFWTIGNVKEDYPRALIAA